MVRGPEFEGELSRAARPQRGGQSSCRASQNGHCAFQIISRRCEPNLEGALRDSSRAKAIAPLPSSEYLFDSTENAVHAPVPCLQSSQCVVTRTTPHACLHDLGAPAVRGTAHAKCREPFWRENLV